MSDLSWRPSALGGVRPRGRTAAAARCPRRSHGAGASR
jgi:hypothetical protein